MAKEKSDIYKQVKNGGINGSPAQMQVHIHPAGRALEWHSRGQRFDPAYLHQLGLRDCEKVLKPMVLGLFCFILFDFSVLAIGT